MTARALELLSAPIGLQLLETISHRDAARLTDEDLRGLLPELHLVSSRHRGDYPEYVQRLRSRAEALRPLAEWLPRRMPSWWSDLDRANQIWLARNKVAPQAALLDVDLSRMHEGASKPGRAFWTSTHTLPSISPWLDHPESPMESSRLWRIVVSPEARVAEIHSPADWSALARSHGPMAEARPDPDWSRVAADYDGVHLSVGGWLTAEDLPYESGDATTELREWNMESTVWLRWSFDSVAALDWKAGRRSGPPRKELPIRRGRR